jgi:hypothetical protein
MSLAGATSSIVSGVLRGGAAGSCGDIRSWATKRGITPISAIATTGCILVVEAVPTRQLTREMKLRLNYVGNSAVSICLDLTAGVG